MSERKNTFDKNLVVEIKDTYLSAYGGYGGYVAVASIHHNGVFSPLYCYYNYSGAAREYFIRYCLEYIGDKDFVLTKRLGMDPAYRHIIITRKGGDTVCNLVKAVNDLNAAADWMLEGINSYQLGLIRRSNTSDLPRAISHAIDEEIAKSLKCYGTPGYRVGQEFDDFAGILANTKINSNCWYQDYMAVGSSIDVMMDPENRLFDISHVAILPLSTDDSCFVIYNGWYFTIAFDENRRVVVKSTCAEEVKMIIDKLLTDHPELKADPKVEVKGKVKVEVVTELKSKTKTKKSTSKCPSHKSMAKARASKSAKNTSVKKTKENKNA